jgi:TolB-like protein
VRRFLVVAMLALLGLPLVDADSSLITKPTVIVYPFTASGSSIDREASAQLATIIATQMSQTGRVVVIPPPPATERKDFLVVAREQHADYYVAGFMSALGDGVSVVEQVVSTTSGIVVFSNTIQLTTYADAAGQGEELANYISRHANRALASIGTPPPATAATAAPSAEAQTNLARLFQRKKKVAPAASAKPTAAPTPAAALLTPSPRPSVAPVVAVPVAIPVASAPPPPVAPIAVLPIAGSADAVLREAAGNRVAAQTHADRVATVETACSGHARETVLSGSLTDNDDSAYSSASASFVLVARSCSGKVLWTRGFNVDVGGPQAAQGAMERVVDAAVSAYLASRKGERS